MTYGKYGKDGNLLAESLDARQGIWVLIASLCYADSPLSPYGSPSYQKKN